MEAEIVITAPLLFAFPIPLHLTFPTLLSLQQKLLQISAMAVSIPYRQLFIDGEWKEPIKKKRIPVINPATEEIIGFFSPLVLLKSGYLCS